MAKISISAEQEPCQIHKAHNFNALLAAGAATLAIRATSASRQLGICATCCKCDIAAQH
jgi:hypothetical protein